MAYSDSFPAIRPSFQFNADAGRLDPRISYSRSTVGSFYGKDKHLSSDNLLLQSSNFSTSWFPNGINGTPTGGQADPAGGTDGFTVVEDAAVGAVHRIFQAANASGDLAFTVYAKQNSGTRYLTLTLFNANNNWTAATFDLAGGSPATGSGSSSVFSSVSATQSASGNGYYKCTIKATGALAGYVYIYLGSSTAAPTGTYGSVTHTGDGTSSLDIAFASLTTTGATDYNATTTQIHRAYAPTLQTAAINAPRFEYSATDSASEAIGQSRGLLIEGQSTNLLAESTDFSGSWQIINATKSLEAIAPNGALNAIAFREGTNSLEKRLLRYYTGGGGSVTISIYAKLLGNTRRLVIREANATGSSAIFDIATGTKVGSNGTIEDVGGGWYRCQHTISSSNTTQAAGFYIIPADGASYTASAFAGDGYSGLLLAMPQAEDQSHASSWISTTSSTATRAADSLSVAMSAVGVSQGPVSAVVEGSAGSGGYPSLLTLSDTTSSNRWLLDRSGAPSTLSTNYRLLAQTNGSTVVNSALSGSASATKFAMRVGTDDFAACAGGGTVVTDTAGVAPVTTTIHIANGFNGGYQANGHVKRVALYNEALSDTNLQSLTAS